MISVHFKASEWAKGPSLTCRRLNQLLPPRMALQYSNEEVRLIRSQCVRYLPGSFCTQDVKIMLRNMYLLVTHLKAVHAVCTDADA